jgi:hypothetical protein
VIASPSSVVTTKDVRHPLHRQTVVLGGAIAGATALVLAAMGALA